MSAYDDLHRQIVEQYQQLTPSDIMSLIHELLNLYQRRMQIRPAHSLLELEGLGAEIWKGIDPQEYVDKERDSWESLDEQKMQIEARRIQPREGEPLHDITEFKGLGKELWEQIDVDAYIEEERNSWDKKGGNYGN